MHEFSLSPGEVVGWAAGDASPIDAALAALGFDGVRRAAAVTLLTQTVTTPGRIGMLDIRQEIGDVQVAVAVGPALVAVLDRPGSDGARSVIVGNVADLPRLIADLVDLGLRPHQVESSPVIVPAVVVDEVAGIGLPEDELGKLQEAFDGYLDPGALEALLGPDGVRWTFSLSGMSDEETDRIADVIDAGNGGLWALLKSAEPTALLATPVTAATLWLTLAGATAATQ